MIILLSLFSYYYLLPNYQQNKTGKGEKYFCGRFGRLVYLCLIYICFGFV